jgi:hypothetical protein
MVLVAGGPLLAAEPEGAARVMLLPSVDRASVVIELDDDVHHTAIHTSDDRTVTVEIGPVKVRVVNQVLQAAARSPLVSQVRVRGVTRGSEGTLIALQIVGKAAISGSVRRHQRRVYIDLEPLTQGAAVERAVTRPRIDGAIQAAKSPPPASRPTPATAPAPRSTAASGPIAVRSTPPPASPSSSGPTPATAPSPAPVREPAEAQAARMPSPSTPPPPASASARTPGAASARPGNAPAFPPSLVDRAEALARIPDVRGLEKLKAESLAAPQAGAEPTAGADALAARIDALLAEARKNQLLADARLFRGSTPPAPAPPPAAAPAPPTPPVPAPADAPAAPLPPPPPAAAAAPDSSDALRASGFQAAMRQLRPELERVNGTISTLTPGAVLSGDVPAQIESVLSRLRALEPPRELGSSHERACGALSTLLTGWVRAPNGQWVIAVGSDPTSLEATRAAMFDYLRAFDRFDRQGAPMTLLSPPLR